MTKRVKEYRRLPGRSGNLVGYSTLWLGPDHLLSLTRTSFSEQYKRFYFRDVQSITIRKTDRRMVWSLILGGLTGLFALIATRPNEVAWLLGGMCVVIFFSSFLINWLRGPTCVSHLRTAVQTEKLPSLSRIRTASKVIRTLIPRIEEAQGRLSPEEIQVKAAEMSAAATPSLGHGIPDAKETRQTKHYNGRLHEVAFFVLLLYGFIGFIDILHNHIVITLSGIALFIGVMFLVIIALIKQNDTNLNGDVRTFTWATGVYLWVTILIGQMYNVFISLNDRKAVMSMWEWIETVSVSSYVAPPFLMGFSIFCTLCSVVLAIFGLILLRRSPGDRLDPRSRSVIPSWKSSRT